jgi:hypothetical protein
VQTSVQLALPSVAATPVPTTAVLDHAIAALAPSAPANGSVPSMNYREGDHVVLSSSHGREVHAGTTRAHPVIASALSRDHRTGVSPPPDGSLANELSLRGVQSIAPLELSSGNRAIDRSSKDSNHRPSRSARFGYHSQVRAEVLAKNQAIHAKKLIPIKLHDLKEDTKES